MELRTIRYFLAVAEHGSLSAAAKAVYVTQPSLSRQMVELERELGSSLFRRTASGLKLNHAGRRFLPMAIDIEQRAQRSGEVMRSLSGAPLNLVAACAVTVAQHILAPFIADTGAPIADVREFDPTVVYTPLESGVADLAMGTVRPPAGFIGRRLALGYLSLQFPPGDTFSGRSTVDIREVADRDLIVVRRGSSIRSILDASAERADLQLQYALQVSSSTIAQSLAAAGRGCAVVVAPAQYGLESATLADESQPLHITEWAAWDPEHYAAPEIESVFDSLAEWIDRKLGLADVVWDARPA